MSVVGFNFDKMLIERTNPIKGNLSVKNDMVIKEVREEEVFIGSKKEKALKFIFEFSSKYEPDVAQIILIGHVLYMADSKETKDIMNKWKKEKDMPQKVAAQVLNTALIKSNIKALHLSQDMNLPPHIRLPTISPKSSARDYIG